MRSSIIASHLIHSSRIQLQYCHVGNQATDCKLGLFQDAKFAGHDRFNINLRRCSVYIWITYVCANFFMACKKQTGVSHSNTEAEIISLDAGLRMEGIPAMNLWDTVIDSLHPQGGGSGQIRQQNTAVGRHSHRRIIHKRQMDTADTTSQHNDAHHIYSMQFVSLFCGCESLIFQHEQTCQRIFRYIGLYEAKASSQQ